MFANSVYMIFVLGITSTNKQAPCKKYGAADDVILACDHCTVWCSRTWNHEAYGTVCTRALGVHKATKYNFWL